MAKPEMLMTSAESIFVVLLSTPSILQHFFLRWPTGYRAIRNGGNVPHVHTGCCNAGNVFRRFPRNTGNASLVARDLDVAWRCIADQFDRAYWQGNQNAGNRRWRQGGHLWGALVGMGHRTPSQSRGSWQWQPAFQAITLVHCRVQTC